MSSFARDFHYGARMLARRPGLTALAVVTLALGIGANGALFSVVHGVLLRPLPYRDADRLVLVHTRWNEFPQGAISVAEYFDLVDQNRSFDDLGLMRGWSLNLTAGDGDPERVVGALVTPSVLTTLGAQALHGRTLAPEEVEKGKDRVMLLGHGLWQRRFGGRQDVLGTRLEIDGESYLVAGIMPPGFAFPNPATEAWLALGLDRADMGHRGNHSYNIVARLKPGVSPEAGQAELEAIAGRLNADYPDHYPAGGGFGFFLRPLREEIVGEIRGALLMLLAAVGFVLLIACANVANLMLARATARHQEMATRTALGASRAQLVRQLLAESLVLSALGGAVALAFAGGGLQALRALEPRNLPRLDEIALDGSAVAFTLALTLVTGLLAGLAPALQASGRELATALREGGRGGDDGRHRLRQLLVVAEVALATVLLIGAGLLVRSFARLQQVDPGFDPENVVTASMAPSPARYQETSAAYDFYDRLLERLAAQPGVASAGAVTNPPLSGWNNDYAVSAEGYETPNGSPAFEEVRHVTPGYFATLGIPLLAGRDFTAADRGDAPPVAILSRSLARRFWGDDDPIGKRLKAGGLDSDNPWITVVGLVGEVRHEGLHTDWKRIWYVPVRQGGWRGMTVMARGADGPLDAGLIRRQVLELDPLQPVFRVVTMEEQLAESTAQPRFNLVLLGTFAALAMALAAVGLYGVISYTVSQRTREIGVRMALGARAVDVLGNVVGGGMILVALGLAAGLAAAAVLTRFLESFLFGVGARDPATYAVNALFLAAVALAACLVPARRATRVEPTVALRYE